MRLFVAIPVDEATRRELEALAGRARRQGDGLRWTRPESWHITLAFLGQTAAERLAGLTERLRAVQGTAFRVEFGAPEILAQAGALVMSVRPSAELTALQHAVSAATEECGFKPEKRPYRPHLTLARPRRGERIRLRLNETAIHGFTAREFVLFESFLEAGGARYEGRARFTLKS